MHLVIFDRFNTTNILTQLIKFAWINAFDGALWVRLVRHCRAILITAYITKIRRLARHLVKQHGCFPNRMSGPRTTYHEIHIFAQKAIHRLQRAQSWSSSSEMMIWSEILDYRHVNLGARCWRQKKCRNVAHVHVTRFCLARLSRKNNRCVVARCSRYPELSCRWDVVWNRRTLESRDPRELKAKT